MGATPGITHIVQILILQGLHSPFDPTSHNFYFFSLLMPLSHVFVMKF